MIDIAEPTSSSTEVERGPGRGALAVAALVVVSVAGLLLLALPDDGDGDGGRAATPTTSDTRPESTSPAPTTGASSRTVDTSAFPEQLRGLDLLLYDGSGPVGLDLDTGERQRHEGGDLLSGRELDVLGSYDAGIVLRSGFIVIWDLGFAIQLRATPHDGNLHITEDGIWYGREGGISFVDSFGRRTSEETDGNPQIIGALDGRPLAWQPTEGHIQHLIASPEVIAEGSPLAGGDGWIAVAECDPVSSAPPCDLRFVDLLTGVEWRLDGEYEGSSSTTIRSNGGRRAVIGFGQPIGDDRVFLVDADELVTRPIDLSSTQGATFDPTDRFILHPFWDDEAPLLCALDLETTRRTCIDPDVDFSAVLVRPGAVP